MRFLQKKLVFALVRFLSSYFSHLAAVAHKNLQIKGSPPEVAGVCYITFCVIYSILRLILLNYLFTYN